MSHKIFVKTTNEWIEVSEEYYAFHIRSINSYRKKQAYHHECCCPRHKEWLCDTDCDNCGYRCDPTTVSLDMGWESEDGSSYTMLDRIVGTAPDPADLIIDADEYNCLVKKLCSLMPEALKIADLREAGMSMKEISDAIGVCRTTLISRLNKLIYQLKKDFPELILH